MPPDTQMTSGGSLELGPISFLTVRSAGQNLLAPQYHVLFGGSELAEVARSSASR